MIFEFLDEFIIFFVFVVEMWKLAKRKRRRQWVGF